MPSASVDLDPATLDIATPEHYERHGYPHREWTWLRKPAPVFWYERPNVDPFWAITTSRPTSSSSASSPSSS